MVVHPDVARAIRKEGRGAPRVVRKAAFAATIVEAGGRNLDYGTDDSLGAFQQRPSQGWGTAAQVQNPRYAARQFIKRAKAIARQNPGISSGELAQAVQRSAFGSKYSAHDVQMAAQRLSRSGKQGGSAANGTLSLRGPQTTDVSLQSHTIPGQSFEAERGQARMDLLSSGTLSVDKLLEYKRTVNSMQDVPDRKVSELAVERNRGARVTVPTRTAARPVRGERRSAVASGKIIGTPYNGTHTLGNWQSDNAVDVSMPVGSKIRAPRNAVVEKVGGSYQGGSSRFDGYQVTIRLANGNRLFYTHLSRPSVKQGQRLAAGQVVGRSGAANGVPHLHLGAERGNPQKFVH